MCSKRNVHSHINVWTEMEYWSLLVQSLVACLQNYVCKKMVKSVLCGLIGTVSLPYLILVCDSTDNTVRWIKLYSLNKMKLTFRRNVSPLSLGSKNKPCKKPRFAFHLLSRWFLIFGDRLSFQPRNIKLYFCICIVNERTNESWLNCNIINKPWLSLGEV
jgi:hypothetical protein